MTRVVGLQGVIQSLERAKRDRVARLYRGIVRAALFAQRTSQKIVPVWQGDLKKSARTEAVKEVGRVSAFVIYTASYALWVHEIAEYAHGKGFNEKYAEKIKAHPGHKYWRRRGVNQTYKFLERAFRENLDKLVTIVKDSMTSTGTAEPPQEAPGD